MSRYCASSTTLNRISKEAKKRGIRSRGAFVKREKPLTFREWVTMVNPRYQWYSHCVKLARILQRVADGEITRLMVFMPPRHGKSEEISRLFSAYYLYRFPDKFVGLISYAADLAFTLSRAARENYVYGEGTLSKSSSAVNHWETTEGGGFWAAGVGGPITGKGFHLGIIDDPVKNAEDAKSERMQEKAKDWYQSTFYTREEPGGAIVVIQTRWDEKDLSGWLLSQEDPDDEPERWHIVNLPAVKESEDTAFPKSCTVEPDNREVGQPLCPERYTLAKLSKMRRAIGPYYFNALYQQHPTPLDGDIFKAEHFTKIVGSVPAGAKFCRAWDNAATEDGGDWTVGALVAEYEKRYYVVDIVRFQKGSHDREQLKLMTAQLDRIRYGHVPIWQEEEGGSAGKDSTLATVQNLAGFEVEAKRPTGNKPTRAEGFASQCQGDNVYLVDGAWIPKFIAELTAFPTGKHDDQVDAVCAAFNKLCAPIDVKDLILAFSAKAARR